MYVPAGACLAVLQVLTLGHDVEHGGLLGCGGDVEVKLGEVSPHLCIVSVMVRTGENHHERERLGGSHYLDTGL